MARLINVGYGNMINASRVIAVINADSSPARRMVQKAKEEGILVDATQGRKTQGLLVMDNGYVVLSAFLPETLTARFHETEGEKTCAAKENSVKEPEEEN